MHAHALLRFALLGTTVLPSVVSAQASPSARDTSSAGTGRWMVGASVGLPLHDGALNGEFVSIAAHWTYIRRGRLGADFSVGVLPRVLSAGAMAVGARGGVALPLALSESVLLIPSAGIGAAGVAGGGGAIGVTGLNSGVALIFRAGSAGVRTGATWHRFRDSAGEALLWEVGFVSAPRWR